MSIFQIKKREQVEKAMDYNEGLLSFVTKLTYHDKLPNNLNPSFAGDDLIESTLSERFGDGYYLIIEVRPFKGGIRCIWKGKCESEHLWPDKQIDQNEVEPMEED